MMPAPESKTDFEDEVHSALIDDSEEETDESEEEDGEEE